MLMYSYVNFEITKLMNKSSRFFLDGDGSSAVIDADLLVAVSPLTKPDEPAEGISIMQDVADNILKILPKGANVPSANKIIIRDTAEDGDNITFQVVGQDHTHRIVCHDTHEYDPKWKLTLRRIKQSSQQGTHFCVSKKDMKRTMDVIRKVTATKDSAIYFELSESILFARVTCPFTDQRVSVGMPRIADDPGAWIHNSDWEQAVLAMTARVRG